MCKSEEDIAKRRRCAKKASEMISGEKDSQEERERVLPYISLTRQVVSTQVMSVELVRVESEQFLDWGFFFHRPYIGLAGEENELWVDFFFFCGTLAGKVPT